MKRDFPSAAGVSSVVPDGLEALYDNWHFSPAVVAGDTLYLSGIIGADENLAVSGDPETQFVQVFETMAHTLHSAGTDFSRVLEITSYHVDIHAHFAMFSAVKDRYLPEPWCAWTAIGITELLLPAALVEVKAIARVG